MIAGAFALIGAPGVYGATPEMTGQGESNIFVTPGLDSDTPKNLRSKRNNASFGFLSPQQ